MKHITLVSITTGRLFAVKVIRHTKCFVIVQRYDRTQPEKLNRKTQRLVNDEYMVVYEN